MLALIKKELRLYWNSPIAYIFIIAFLGITFWVFFRTFFLMGQVDMRSFFSIVPWMFLFLIPALTMRLWSEEYRQGTIETLMTSSLKLKDIILGKFLASFFFLAITVGATILLPISLSFIGNLDWGVVIVGYIGVLLLGALFMAIGLVISSISQNQIVAFIVSVLICFALFILGEPIVTFALPGFLAPIFNFIAIGSHYDSMVRGVIDSRDIIYYGSLLVICYFLNKEALLKRKS